MSMTASNMRGDIERIGFKTQMDGTPFSKKKRMPGQGFQSAKRTPTNHITVIENRTQSTKKGFIHQASDFDLTGSGEECGFIKLIEQQQLSDQTEIKKKSKKAFLLASAETPFDQKKTFTQPPPTTGKTTQCAVRGDHILR